MSKLPRLSSLGLGWNFASKKHLLQFKELSSKNLVRHLSHLENLDLSGVNVFSIVPNIFDPSQSRPFHVFWSNPIRGVKAVPIVIPKFGLELLFNETLVAIEIIEP